MDSDPDIRVTVNDRQLFISENGVRRSPRERRLIVISVSLAVALVALAIALIATSALQRAEIQRRKNICNTDPKNTSVETTDRDRCHQSTSPGKEFNSSSDDNKTSENICLSVECIRSANNLVRSMDTRVDPCDDFYQFACGRWEEDHMLQEGAISNDWFKETVEHFNRQIKEFLESNETTADLEPVKQAKKLYRTCVDTDKVDQQGLGPVLNALRRMSPGASPVTAETEAATTGWQPEHALAEVRRALGHSVLMGVSVSPETRDRRRNRISVSMPLSIMSLHGPTEEARGAAAGATGAWGADDDWLLSAYARGGINRADAQARKEEYVGGALEMAARWESSRQTGRATDTPRPAAMRIARDIIAVEKSLTKIKEGNQTTGRAGVVPDMMTVQELQAELDRAAGGTFRLNLTLYLQLLFEGEPGVQLRLGADAGEDRDLLQVYDRKYLRALAPLLASLSDRTLQSFVWWDVFKVLMPYSNSETRMLTTRYLKALLGVAWGSLRSQFCSNLVNQLMGLAVGRHFYDGAALNSTRAQVEQMFEDIRWAFDERVDALDWMEGATKAATREKAAAMGVYVAFPDWLKDDAVLDEYYRGITVNEDAFLDSLIGLLRRRVSESLTSIRRKNTKDGIWRLRPPMQVNAIYVPTYNSMVVQVGFLQFPFFRLGLPVLDYAAIGSIIGHELTHGFDANGRKYDKNGNILHWWSDNTIKEFENRAMCFVQQYSQYQFKGLSQKVNGLRTLGENIADNGGVREALHAYRRLRRRGGARERALPGLERYSAEQLFFLSFANIWCGKWKKSLIMEVLDPHSPKYIRANGVLVNSQEFTDAWKCPAGSGMNPVRTRCAVW